jgi:aryl-alcohol dehydrogenase-like predicted oxidoreductase
MRFSRELRDLDNGTEVEYRALGTTGFKISSLSFGTWAIGGSWGISVDERMALDALHFAVDQGVNFFDTADVYGGGRAETLLGQSFAHRPDIIIATKFCRGGDIHNKDTYLYDSVRHFAEQSLLRLQRDAIDLYQIHCPPTWVIEQGDVFDVLDRLQREGLVRSYGVSVETVEEGHLAMRHRGVSALQVIFNLFRQKPLETLLPEAKKNDVGILARVPLASGLLTGKFQLSDTFPSDDHRNFNRDGESFNVGETFSGLPFAKGVELSDQLRWIQNGRGSMAAAALRWILDQPGVTTAIPGFKNSQQVASNLVALKAKPFSPEELERLNNFYHSAVAEHIRGPY